MNAILGINTEIDYICLRCKESVNITFPYLMPVISNVGECVLAEYTNRIKCSECKGPLQIVRVKFRLLETYGSPNKISKGAM